jgi:type II secretory pathway pseudopilin PulG
MQEGGFTLIELLVASALAIVVFGAVLAMVESSQQVQARDTEWALTLQEDRAGLARMAREIRQASKVEKAEASTIELLATIGSTSLKVTYECGVTQPETTFHECVRSTEEGKKKTTIVRDVLNPTEVFCYSHGTKACTSSPNATERAEVTVATLKIELPAKGTLKQAGSSGYTHKVVLEDAAFMRNLELKG